MKLKKYKYSILLPLLFLLIRCNKYEDWKKVPQTTISKFDLISPLDSTISPTADGNNTITFKWHSAVTGNETQSFYKILFNKKGGDVSFPVDSIIPNNAGLDTFAVIADTVIGRIANKAGISSNSGGTLIWNIVASTGVVSSQSNQTGSLQIIQ